ncbi:MAG: T9SS type A sorting domain-containing protein [candidate division Zixibacteria bacterium]|nr:T9SS type A sorting domain-containing protein [candidate division Zixibacteria bacterium]
MELLSKFAKVVFVAAVVSMFLVVSVYSEEDICWNQYVVGDIYTCWSAYALDFDLDGDNDVIGTGTFENRISWWENDSYQNFAERLIVGDFDSATDFHSVDLDSDGDNDILGCAFFGEIAWWENDGDMNFTKHYLTNFNKSYDLFSIDMDNDNDMDFVVAGYSTQPYVNDIAWFENDGNQNFTQHSVESQFDGASRVHAIDMDGDGDIDILGAAFVSDQIAWWENFNNQQAFIRHTIDDNFDGARTVYAVDLDKDGDVDVLGAGQECGEYAWWRNNGNQHFTKLIIDDGFVGPWDIYAEDLDNDNDLDVLGTDYWGDEIAWWENNGSENFSKYSLDDNFDGAKCVYAHDIDVDGDMDILGSACWEYQLFWWQNDSTCLPLTIQMRPIDPPVFVPAGGSFNYEGILTNNSNGVQYTEVWVKLRLPDGTYHGPVKHWREIEVPVEDANHYYPMVQRIPDFAPEGTYHYIAYCGIYPSIVDSSYFTFTVTPYQPPGGVTHWKVTYGSGNRNHNLANIPETPELHQNYPNPFNASTVIRYSVPRESQVRLDIYNLMGERIETLVDDSQQRGMHMISWDASEYSSGIYFYRLKAGEMEVSKTMSLVK